MQQVNAIRMKQINVGSKLHPVVVCLISIGTLQPVAVVFAAERCTVANITRVVSVQGTVVYNLGGKAAAQAAKLNDTLCAGDVVRVGAKSRAVLRLPNETTIPLDQNTIFQLKEPSTDKQPTLIDLIQGAIHIITRTPKPFKVNTPFMNAAVEGTEFYVGVDENEARVAVIEGKVTVSNEQGQLLLTNNEAATARQGQAPVKVLTIKPRDAVQWALYYPPVIVPQERIGDITAPLIAESYALFNLGDTTEAINRLERIAEWDRTADFYTYRASLLLHVGRADEAELDIEQAKARKANDSNALALQTIIAIVRNDKAKALELANQAIQADQQSAAARIAKSYALQANFKIEEALKAAREATERDNTNALAWARVAELELSIPNYDKSKEAAEQAVKLNPNLARTQSILGFANLTRIDTKAAKQNFNQAIELDQADPLPRLGLGLAKIREGQLQEGREQIEIAAALDPENSLIRSYLGKAYYEEKRDTEAGRQFELAKQRDPKDPTPYFYDAIRNQANNRLREALEEFRNSKALNSNRAVYRSGLLLDADNAARSASLARAYYDLGFDELAAVEAAGSLAIDPTNSSAHRFLSDAYTGIPRHEIARVSELLQAQLLQSVNLRPVQPSISLTNLDVRSNEFLSQPTLNEYSVMFERNRPLVSASILGGNKATFGDEVVFSGINNKWSYSIGQFHYKTDGFRANNDLRHDIYDLFLQFAATPELNFQAELRKRNTAHGDLSMDFDPKNFSNRDRIHIDQDSIRLGARFSPAAKSNILISLIQTNRDGNSDLFLSGSPDIHERTSLKAKLAEIQYFFAWSKLHLVAGGGATRVVRQGSTEFDFSTITGGLQCLEPMLPCSLPSNSVTHSRNEYLYANFFPSASLRLTIGLSHDRFDDQPLNLDKWSPKFGLYFTPSELFTIRAAEFTTLKRELITDQTLEPTTIAGFNQFFDDLNGTKTKRSGLGFDLRLSPVLQSVIEASNRYLEVPSSGAGGFEFKQQKEKLYSAFLYWQPVTTLALTFGYVEERFQQETESTTNSPLRVTTRTVPVRGRYKLTDRMFGTINPILVLQNVNRKSGSVVPAGKERFWIVNTVLGYRFPARKGLVTLEVNNLFNQTFSYQDDNFRTSETRIPRYRPGRNLVLRATMDF